MPKLTEKQRLFIEALLGQAKGNATKAAKMAGVPAKSAAVMGARWLRKVHIQRALTKRLQRREARTDITNERIDNELALIGFSKVEASKDKTAALKELNKVRGRHSININLRDKTYEQLLAESRKDLE